ncbi:hypothetical protein M378DRAFT_9889 [Amanita muscaria Koide BX008]|uniref:EamA domain-containing protein n=1 Tax=Amanita muscaria (strain Koide BX008) TaxID=946122 RepID=A0A0C2XDE1_AMAMK|nr:hypothetical protein M378DRAFT_9889 [Amanita muscaria Koide BX008]
MSSPLNPQNERQPLINSEEQAQTKSVTEQFISDNAGLLLVILSEMFFSMMNAAVKFLRTDDAPIPVLQVILIRMVNLVSDRPRFLMVMQGLTGNNMSLPCTDVGGSILGPKGVRLLLLFRGVTGFVGVFGVYHALQYLSLPDATVLFFLSPLCTAMAGSLFLKETFGISQILAGFVSLIGVTLIARPPFLFGPDEMINFAPGVLAVPEVISVNDPMERMFAVCVALIGVLGITGGFVSVRAIGKQVHPLIVMTHFAVDCILISGVGMIVTKTPFILPSLTDSLILVMIGLFSFVGQTILTVALRLETAGRASIGLYTQIIFATIFQLAFFHTPESWLSILGTGLILSSAIYVAVTKKDAIHDRENRRHRTLDDGGELEAGAESCEPFNNTSHMTQSQSYGATDV